MPGTTPSHSSAELLNSLVTMIERRGPDLALFLVYDRPSRVTERPGLERAFFAQRCVSDEQLRDMVEVFRSVGAYVEVFEGERPFIEALASGRVQSLRRPLKMVYNGIEGSIAHDGFEPGRKALIPTVADSYGILCANSSAYACALGRHKFHYLTVLRSLGLPTPRTWHFHADRGWVGGLRPTHGLKVIAKSTYESWSVGVTDESVFQVDDSTTTRVATIAERIGQAVTVQEFIAGTEVCVPVFTAPEPFASAPVEAVLAKAPGDPDAVMTIDDNLTRGGVSHRPYEASVAAGLQQLATRAFDVLELRSFARVDFRVDQAGIPFIFDIGVSPGVSRKSSAYVSVASWGFSYERFLLAVMAASLSRTASIN